MSLKFRSFWVLVLFSLCGWAVEAGSPNTIRFQGRLTDSGGNPVVGPDVRVRFAIYSVPSGGTPLWEVSGDQSVSTNEAGLFATDVGPLPASIFSDNSEVYLQVWVNDGASFKPLHPRQKLASVPYSFAADYAVNAGTAAFVLDNSITSFKIQAGAVGTSQLQDESVTRVKLASAAVTSDKILDGNITRKKLDKDAVSSENIEDGSIQNADLKVNSIARDRLDKATFELPGAGLLPAGAIIMSTFTSCPAGFSEFLPLRNRVPVGTDFSAQSSYVPNSPAATFGSDNSTFEVSTPNQFSNVESIRTGDWWVNFSHPKLVGGYDAAGGADNIGMSGYDHAHSLDIGTAYPPALTVIFCIKN